MSIFDISSQKPYQFLHKWDSFQSTEGDPTIFFAGIFALKKVSGQYKTKNINILGTKLVFLSVFFISLLILEKKTLQISKD